MIKLIVLLSIFHFVRNQIFLWENARSLVMTSGGLMKLKIGLSMPIDLPVSLAWTQNVQYQYPMITNSTQLSYLHLIREFRSSLLTRSNTYQFLAHAWNQYGINGTACVLQTICDIGKYSLSHDGILGEIIDTIFTPHKNTENIYKEAMNFGKRGGNCKIDYSYCKENFLDLFTKIRKLH